MKKTNTAGDAMSTPAIDEILFQISLLALHTAIGAAESVVSMDDDGQLHSLVQRPREPARSAHSLERPEPGDFE